MTITTSASATTYQGNGATTVFPFAFPVTDATTLVATVTDNTQSPAIVTTLTAAQYNVTGIGGSTGGSVTYPLSGSPLATGLALTLQRVVPYVQDTSLVNQGGFYPDVLEGALDILTEQTQQLAEGLSRAVQVPVGSGMDPGAYLATIQTAETASASSAAAAAAAAAACAPVTGDLSNIDAVAAALANINLNAANIAVIRDAGANAAAAAASAASAAAIAASTTTTFLTLGYLADWGMVTDAPATSSNWGTVP